MHPGTYHLPFRGRIHNKQVQFEPKKSLNLFNSINSINSINLNVQMTYIQFVKFEFDQLKKIQFEKLTYKLFKFSTL